MCCGFSFLPSNGDRNALPGTDKRFKKNSISYTQAAHLNFVDNFADLFATSVNSLNALNRPSREILMLRLVNEVRGEIFFKKIPVSES